MPEQRHYQYVIYQIENDGVHQTPEYTLPICGFSFEMDAREYCACLNARYNGLRFIYTGMSKQEV